mgnify:FL=1
MDFKASDLLSMLPPVLVALLSLVEVSPIKINPWSGLAKWLGRAFNAEVLADLKAVQKAQQDTRSALDKHQAADDEYKAECHRAALLAFNTSLLRGELHTQEDFFDAFRHIDQYEDYCRSHPGYKNNRASHAIANIGRVYDERLKARDFLGGVTHEE